MVQDYKHAAVAAARGVAVREVQTGAGPADYVLFVDGQAVGVIEAKNADSTLFSPRITPMAPYRWTIGPYRLQNRRLSAKLLI